VIQKCQGGTQTAWIQSTPEGGEEPEHPAPFVSLTAPEGEHGEHAEDDEMTEDAEHAEATSASGEDSDDSGNGLSIAALIVGVLGLATGGTALVKVRGSKE